MTNPTLREITKGVHVAEAPQRFYGLEVGARMTVLSLKEGLLVHSPLEMDPAAIAHLGKPRWVLAPNLLHHLYVGPWMDAGLEGWAAPGLPQKRSDLSFRGVVTPDAQPFGDEVLLLPLTCFSLTNEVILLHRPSRTLVVTDFVFNFSPTSPWTTRVAMRCSCAYPGCKTSVLERVGMQRTLLRRELAQIAEWDFDRVIMAHGDIIETGGKEALLGAFGWL